MTIAVGIAIFVAGFSAGFLVAAFKCTPYDPPQHQKRGDSDG